MVFNYAMKNTFVKLLIIIAFAFPVAACGVKPKNVDPPAAVEDDLFPHRYPAEQTK